MPHLRHVFRSGLLFLISGAALLRAADYYLSPEGNDTNDGHSAEKAWKSLAKASATTFGPGDRILFKAGGVWEGALTPSGCGAAVKPIAVGRYGEGDAPRLEGRGTSGQTPTATLLLSGQSHWRVEGLEITNTGPAVADRSGIRVVNPGRNEKARCSDIVIRNCRVHHVDSDPKGGKINGGIIFDGVFDDIEVDACHVSDVTKEGIRNNCGAKVRCTNVRFTRNRVENVFGDGIVITGVSKGGYAAFNRLKNTCITKSANYAGLWLINSRDSLVEYNEVSDIAGGFVYDGEAFDDDLGCSGDTFQYNYSHDNAGGFFLIMPGANNLTVRYNISQNDGGGAKQELIHYTNNIAKNNLFHNNTFYIGPKVVTNLFNDLGTKAAGKVVNFRNNLVYCDGRIASFSPAGFGAGTQFKNNAFFPAEKFKKADGYFAGQTGLVTADPGLLAPGTGGEGFASLAGYQLKAGSPCLAGGAPEAKGGARDFTGAAVPSGRAGIGALWVTPGTSATQPLKVAMPETKK